MDHFTPLTALVGGSLIGLASAVLWLGNGRIAGISGIFGQLLPPTHTVLWRLVFIGSLVLGAWVSSILVPGLGIGGPGGVPAQLAAPPANSGINPLIWVAISGLLTGFGTRISNGCTSGHGVCGLARLSVRSLVAVLVFFSVAIVTVSLTGIV